MIRRDDRIGILAATVGGSAKGWLLTLVVILTSGGCVRRRLTVRTNPPGAVVSVDNQLIGTSPAATSFTYYGTREIRVEKDGFRTEAVKNKIRMPWYQLPVLDFITETLWPWEIRDERIVDIELVPQTLEPSENVLQRADQLRNQSRAGVVTAPR
ncbi:MAG: PEGA domain-containing protein [Planctomycetaceae bacterium]|nr:MAG: PEGA domain-containing protein [Planctomycetaceae bacterium]